MRFGLLIFVILLITLPAAARKGLDTAEIYGFTVNKMVVGKTRFKTVLATFGYQKVRLYSDDDGGPIYGVCYHNPQGTKFAHFMRRGLSGPINEIELRTSLNDEYPERWCKISHSKLLLDNGIGLESGKPFVLNLLGQREPETNSLVYQFENLYASFHLGPGNKVDGISIFY
jgi:hypothetical protein